MTGHYTGINICDGDRRRGGEEGRKEGGREAGSSTKAASEEEQENRCQNGEPSIPSIHWYVPWAAGRAGVVAQLRAKQDYTDLRQVYLFPPRVVVD